MVPLAVNTVLPQSLRLKPQLILAILPLGLAFASFLPLTYFAAWLERFLGISPSSAVKSHPNGILWITVFVFVMVALMAGGYIVGWLVNALLSRYALGWSWSTVRAVYMRSQVPSEWLKVDARPRPSGPPLGFASMQKWEAQRAAGPIKFILTRGVLAWGSPMFLAMYVAPTLTRGSGFRFAAVILQLMIWTCAGAFLGTGLWFYSEWNYRKFRRNSEAK
jgi:hypothetical protein